MFFGPLYFKVGKEGQCIYTKCVKFVKGHFSKGHHQDLLSNCEQKQLQLWIHKGPYVQEWKEVMNGSRPELVYANIKINILWNC
jgi:hypothetical protein